MEPNQNMILWGSIVGAVLPMLIAKINLREWSSEAKAATAFVCCLIAAAGTAWFKGEMTAMDVTSAFLGVFAAAIVTYNQFYKPGGVAAKLERKAPGASGPVDVAVVTGGPWGQP